MRRLSGARLCRCRRLACFRELEGYRGFHHDFRQHLALSDQPEMSLVACSTAIEPQKVSALANAALMRDVGQGPLASCTTNARSARGWRELRSLLFGRWRVFGRWRARRLPRFRSAANVLKVGSRFQLILRHVENSMVRVFLRLGTAARVGR